MARNNPDNALPADNPYRDKSKWRNLRTYQPSKNPVKVTHVAPSPTTRLCKGCEKDFEPKRSYHRYCTPCLYAKLKKEEKKREVEDTLRLLEKKRKTNENS